MLSVDGRGEVGLVDEYTPPSLELLTEEFRGGGMDASEDIDMGMAKMEVTFKMNGYDIEIMKLWGVAQGTTVPIVARGALKNDDGVVTTLLHTMSARVTKMEQETWKAGEKSGVVITASLPYFKVTHGSTVVIEIDVKGSKRIINGVDQLAGMRTALGL
ncbi:phage major tail tube protein [Marinomonas rhizomae]|nr:phage major tail tube protein [Marinomonas rhizomae]